MNPVRRIVAMLPLLVMLVAASANELTGLRVVPPKPISPVRLIDHNGRNTSFPQTGGKWKLVFFGYTRCPDVCPTTMFTVRQAMQRLGSEADKLDIAFISIDGQRDKPEDLKRFVSYYGKTVTGFTGELKNVKMMESQFGVTTRKFQGKTALAYSLQHSIFLYLLDPDNRLRAMFSGAISPATLANEMRHYLTGIS